MLMNRLFSLIVGTLIIAVFNCAPPPTEKEMDGKIRGKASLRLADGSTISRDDSDEYNPYLLKMSDGYLVLVFGSDRTDCGSCTGHNVFMARSLTAFDGEFLPYFSTPLPARISTNPINEPARINFAATASGTSVILYLNYSSGASQIYTGTYTNPQNPNVGSIALITNTNHYNNTIIGISADGSQLYTTDSSEIAYAFNPTNSTAENPFGYGMNNSTSAAQVRQENSGYTNAILGVSYGSTFAAAGDQWFGPILDLDTSLALSGLSITGMSTFSADSAANDRVLFSAFDFFEGFSEDLYLITSHSSKDLWDIAGFPGFDFAGGPSVGPLRIFVTASQYQGNLGGIAGADANCNADGNKPLDGSIYKALVGVTGVRDLSTDWPLLPNNLYMRTDFTPIEITDALGKFPTTLMNSFATSVPANSFSGIQNGWIVSASNGTANCSGWTGTGGSQYYATPTTTDMTTGFFTGSVACTTFLTLICVEQP